VRRLPGPWLEIPVAIFASPLALAGRAPGALIYFALLGALAGRGALRELAAPLERLHTRDRDS
jgi:hypothetical protein